LPIPTLVTVFEVVNGGKVYSVKGSACSNGSRNAGKNAKAKRVSVQPTANAQITFPCA
jgi:hypothetical protein